MYAVTLTGCGTVAAVLLLRCLFAKGLPRRILVLLWIGALAVLLLPGRLQSFFSTILHGSLVPMLYALAKLPWFIASPMWSMELM